MIHFVKYLLKIFSRKPISSSHIPHGKLKKLQGGLQINLRFSMCPWKSSSSIFLHCLASVAISKTQIVLSTSSSLSMIFSSLRKRSKRAKKEMRNVRIKSKEIWCWIWRTWKYLLYSCVKALRSRRVAYCSTYARANTLRNKKKELKINTENFILRWKVRRKNQKNQKKGFSVELVIYLTVLIIMKSWLKRLRKCTRSLRFYPIIQPLPKL